MRVCGSGGLESILKEPLSKAAGAFLSKTLDLDKRCCGMRGQAEISIEEISRPSSSCSNVLTGDARPTYACPWCRLHTYIHTQATSRSHATAPPALGFFNLLSPPAMQHRQIITNWNFFFFSFFFLPHHIVLAINPDHPCCESFI